MRWLRVSCLAARELQHKRGIWGSTGYVFPRVVGGITLLSQVTHRPGCAPLSPRFFAIVSKALACAVSPWVGTAVLCLCRYENLMAAGSAPGSAAPNFTRHTVSAAVPKARFVAVAWINGDTFPDILAAHEAGDDGCECAFKHLVRAGLCVSARVWCPIVESVYDSACTFCCGVPHAYPLLHFPLQRGVVQERWGLSTLLYQVHHRHRHRRLHLRACGGVRAHVVACSRPCQVDNTCSVLLLCVVDLVRTVCLLWLCCSIDGDGDNDVATVGWMQNR